MTLTDPALAVRRRIPTKCFHPHRQSLAQVYLDSVDPLSALRNEFHIPTHGQMPPGCGNPATPTEPVIYLCGNSLGLQPKGTARLVYEELNKWAARYGVQS